MTNKLPDFVRADLYRNNIVPRMEDKILAGENKKENIAAIQAAPEPEKKWFLGDNKKRILIIVADENAVIINDENLAFLSKILAAFTCTLADVTITNHSAEAKKFSLLKEIFHPQNVFLFGVSTLQVQLPFTIPYYQVQPYNNCLFLSAPELVSLNNDTHKAKVEKSKLWVSLKKVFEK